jgi:hypothetical protein
VNWNFSGNVAVLCFLMNICTLGMVIDVLHRLFRRMRLYLFVNRLVRLSKCFFSADCGRIDRKFVRAVQVDLYVLFRREEAPL